jgi:hypothetical protein
MRTFSNVWPLPTLNVRVFARRNRNRPVLRRVRRVGRHRADAESAHDTCPGRSEEGAPVYRSFTAFACRLVACHSAFMARLLYYKYHGFDSMISYRLMYRVGSDVARLDFRNSGLGVDIGADRPAGNSNGISTAVTIR